MARTTTQQTQNSSMRCPQYCAQTRPQTTLRASCPKDWGHLTSLACLMDSSLKKGQSMKALRSEDSTMRWFKSMRIVAPWNTSSKTSCKVRNAYRLSIITTSENGRILRWCMGQIQQIFKHSTAFRVSFKSQAQWMPRKGAFLAQSTLSRMPIWNLDLVRSQEDRKWLLLRIRQNQTILRGSKRSLVKGRDSLVLDRTR